MTWEVWDLRPDKDEVHVVPCWPDRDHHTPEQTCTCFPKVTRDGPLDEGVVVSHREPTHSGSIGLLD